MATLDWTCETVDGVTLVELVVTAERSERVRIESKLSPVWPPRRQGRPEAGWDGERFEGRVEADDRLVVGFASPAEPVEPPVDLQTEPPAEDDDIDPRDVIRALGDGVPPRDAVPAGDSPTHDETAAVSTVSPADNAESAGIGRKEDEAGDRLESSPASTEGEPGAEPEAGANNGKNAVPTALPPAVEAYFEALDRRITAAEQLADPGTVDQAREAVTAAGGIEAVGGLERQLRADRARLERVETRQQTLASRLEAVEIPVERLDRVT
ncbi:DUF7857 domain-containing protein [Halovenus sp. HT40]|uniref:DUF7857 domain-containing protein n=1 Tax=Halovenus sp. HT40 TaxID=3126691 RepID=UPI00300F60B5